MGRLDKSELIFKIIAYTLTTMFAICCVYPLIYAVSGALSGIDALAEQSSSYVIFSKVNSEGSNSLEKTDYLEIQVSGQHTYILFS